MHAARGRLQGAAAFKALLATAPCARSAHFAVHHLDAPPERRLPARIHRSSTELSTDHANDRAEHVDNQLGAQGWWWGEVIAKRHARRAVTRNQLRRVIRAVVAEAGSSLPPGQWLVRLRAPFDRQAFPSARSAALRQAARAELQQLLARARHAPPRAEARPRGSAAPRVPGTPAPGASMPPAPATGARLPPPGADT